MSLCRDGGARRRVTAALVTLHVASYAESFPAARLRTLVRFFPRMAMAMNAQATWPRKGLVAGRANVSILRLGECGLAGRADIVVMLPWI